MVIDCLESLPAAAGMASYVSVDDDERQPDHRVGRRRAALLLRGNLLPQRRDLGRVEQALLRPLPLRLINFIARRPTNFTVNLFPTGFSSCPATCAKKEEIHTIYTVLGKANTKNVNEQ